MWSRPVNPDDVIGNESSSLTHGDVAEMVSRAFNDGYVAVREKRNARRRKGPRTSGVRIQTTNDYGRER